MLPDHVTVRRTALRTVIAIGAGCCSSVLALFLSTSFPFVGFPALSLPEGLIIALLVVSLIVAFSFLPNVRDASHILPETAGLDEI